MGSYVVARGFSVIFPRELCRGYIAFCNLASEVSMVRVVIEARQDSRAGMQTLFFHGRSV